MVGSIETSAFSSKVLILLALTSRSSGSAGVGRLASYAPGLVARRVKDAFEGAAASGPPVGDARDTVRLRRRTWPVDAR
jgi:hypothetical protein